MGANAGPDIVSDGLVLALDAADNNSFRGEPTENIAAANLGFSNMAQGGISYSFVEVENGWRKYSISGTGNSNTYPYTFNILLSTILVSTRTSFSIKYKTNVESKYVSFGDPRMVNIVYAAGRSSTHTQENGYRTAKLENVSPASGTEVQSQRIYFLSRPIEGAVFNPSTDFLYFKDVQAERSPYATRFTTGTRGTTVANGGGWADISGNDNHGEILNGTSTSNDNTVLGALDFDGTNDYIPITSLLNSESIGASTKLTISMWLNQTSKGNRMPFSTGQTGNDRIYYWSQSSLNTWRVGNYTSTTGHGSLPANGVWYHTAIVIDGLTVAGYFNGELDYTGTYSAFTTADYATLGRHGSTNAYYYSGKIAGVTVHNQALTAQEILQNYNATKTRFGL